MSLADKIFVAMCKDILENGTSTEGEKVRPHWEDGSSAYTVKKFGVVNRYDLSKEFPAITLRKTAIGMPGRTRTVPSERPTAISWG